MPRTSLECHEQVDWLGRWKERLGVVALVACLVWLGPNLVLSEQRDFYSTRGPVHSVHQSWEAQCSACHEPFTPISSHSWSAPFLGDPQVSSQKCQTCHEGAVHHAGQQPDLTCASCHREHRGREASLVILPDRDCTQCHHDLSKHHSGQLAFATEVSGFSTGGHPEFRSIKADPGKLKFNHELHLKAGMALGADGGVLMTLEKIPEPFRQRYRDQQLAKHDGAAVQLQCASCHQLDAGDFGVGAGKAKEFPFSVLGQRSAGAYMAPITYENQCQACHPLTLERKTPDDPKAGLLTIPHRLKPNEIHELLENYYTSQVVRGQAGFLDKKVIRPLPGKLPGVLDATTRAKIEQKVEQAEKDLYLSKRLCAECHHFDGKPIPEAIKTGQAPALRVAAPQVPTVWFQHAKFNHTAHRAVRCTECHVEAVGSKVHTDVLIPTRETCVQCHAPKTSVGTPGAPFNCTECHRYHNGDHAAQGIGAASRNPRQLLDTKAFLRP